MNTGFNPTISNVFTYPDMASQLERLNDKQSAGLRNAINYAVDLYKFKKLNDELKMKDAEKKAEEERRKDMAESWADYDESVGAKNTDWQTYDEWLANTGYTPIQDADAYLTADELEDLDESGLDANQLYGGYDRGPAIVAIQPYQTGGQAAYDAAQKAAARRRK